MPSSLSAGVRSSAFVVIGARPANAMRHIGRQEMMSKRLQQTTVNTTAIGESHLQFRRMHIDVDHFRRHIHSQKTNRLSSDHQQPAVRFAQGMLQRTITNVPAVQKQVLHAVVAAADRRIADVTADPDLRIVAMDRNQRLSDLATKERFDPIGPTRRRGQIVESVCRCSLSTKWIFGFASASRVKASTI